MKLIASAIITIFLSFSSFCQIQLGIKAGTNISGARESYSENIPSRSLSPKVGFQLGMWSSFSLNKKLKFVPEFVFAQEGFNWNEGLDRNIHLYYLNLNIPAAYKLHQKVFVEFGPQLGKILRANYRVNGQANNYNNNYKEGIDVALLLGTKFAISNNIVFGLRYIHGLTDIAEETITFSSATNTSQSIEIDQTKFGLQISLFIVL